MSHDHKPGPPAARLNNVFRDRNSACCAAKVGLFVLQDGELFFIAETLKIEMPNADCLALDLF